MLGEISALGRGTVSFSLFGRAQEGATPRGWGGSTRRWACRWAGVSASGLGWLVTESSRYLFDEHSVGVDHVGGQGGGVFLASAACNKNKCPPDPQPEEAHVARIGSMSEVDRGPPLHKCTRFVARLFLFIPL
jgi:hypothetical protein